MAFGKPWTRAGPSALNAPVNISERIGYEGIFKLVRETKIAEALSDWLPRVIQVRAEPERLELFRDA
jgi:hypothetical protein